MFETDLARSKILEEEMKRIEKKVESIEWYLHRYMVGIICNWVMSSLRRTYARLHMNV